MSDAIGRRLTVREARYMQYKTENPDMSDRAALLKAGFDYVTAAHAERVVSPEMREHIDKLRLQAVEASLNEAVVNASEVLSELCQQLTRLTSMLGHSLKEIYREDGSLLPVHEWPAHWAERLVTEIETREESVRSHDGV